MLGTMATPNEHRQPDLPTAGRANTFPWPPVLLLGLIAAAHLLGRTAPLPWPGLDDLPARIVGRSIGAAGVALAVWAVIELRRHGTTVMPDGVSHVLVTSGPFRICRNPIYLGEAMALLGIAEISKNIWYAAAAGAFMLLMTKLQIGAEEAHLEARFGEAYRAYKARRRRWL